MSLKPYTYHSRTNCKKNIILKARRKTSKQSIINKSFYTTFCKTCYIQDGAPDQLSTHRIESCTTAIGHNTTVFLTQFLIYWPCAREMQLFTKMLTVFSMKMDSFL